MVFHGILTQEKSICLADRFLLIELLLRLSFDTIVWSYFGLTAFNSIYPRSPQLS